MTIALHPERILSAALVALAALFATAPAQARQSSPDVVYERYEANIERQIEAAETRIERQVDRADATIERLIDREASEAAILRAVNSALRGFTSTIRSVSNSLLKTANSSKRTLVRIEAAAERRDDTDTAEEAAAYIEDIDGDIEEITDERDEVLAALEALRQLIGGSEDPGEAYEDATDELVADFEDFTNSLDDDAEDDDDDDEDDDGE